MAEDESLYRTLMDILPQMVWVVRADDRMSVYANRHFQDYFGSIGPSRDDRTARSHPDDVEAMERTWASAAAEGRRLDAEGRLRRHDGVYRWHRVIATPILRTGEIVEWLGTALDIDEVVRARQTLRETTDLLSLSQEAAGAGVFDFNLLTGAVVLSRESLIMHGFDEAASADVDVEAWRVKVNAEDAAGALVAVEAACRDHQTYSAEFRVPLPGGGVRWIHGIGRAHYDADGTAVRMIGLNLDVTDRKMSEARLIEATTAAETARRDAEQASAAKSDFLASMSHEIRTPLNSIIGYTDLLLDRDHDRAKARRWLELIQESGAALLTVVDDILDFSRIEAGQVKLDTHAFPLSAMIENVLSMIRGIASKSSLAIERVVPADIPKHVVGDANRLRQVLLNLLNNAVKFTPAGSVKLVVAMEGVAARTCRLRFSVVDTGIGISPEGRRTLFDRFSQGDGTITRRFGGTGLGLAISKSLVELMDGAIGVESRPGHGSTFWFTVELPVATGDTKAVDDTIEPNRDGSPLSILLVEDVEINQDLARLVLEGRGHEVEVASDGYEAIRKVQEQRFDVVLMDIQMPGMDGITASHAIRALPHSCSRTPIIAMTANVLPRQIAMFKAAGIDDHVGKPFRRKELFEAIERWSQVRPRPVYSSPGARSAAFDRAVFEDFRATVGASIFHRMIDKFKIELETRVAKAPPIDADRLAMNAHALIAAAGSFGFIGFSRLCREVEESCRQGGDVALNYGRLGVARDGVLAELASLADDPPREAVDGSAARARPW